MIHIYNEDFLKAFGTRLKKLREEKQLSQRAFSEIAGIKYSQIGRIERGEQNPTLSTVYVLAKALELTVSDLLNFEFSEKK